MAGGESFFDAVLAWQQPVHGGVEIVFVRVLLDAAFPGQGRVERLRAQGAGGSQFGTGKKNAGGNHGHAEVALRAGFGAKQSGQPELVHGGENGAHMAVGQRAGDLEGLARRAAGNHGITAAFEQRPKALDNRLWPLGKVGQGAVANFAGVAIGFTQEEAGRRVAVAD